MILYVWKIFVILFLLEKYSIFNQGITQITCLCHYEDTQRYTLPELKMLGNQHYINQEKNNFHSNVVNNEVLLTKSVEEDNFRDRFPVSKDKNEEPKKYKRENHDFQNVNTQNRIQLTHDYHGNKSSHADLDCVNIQAYELEPNQINEKSIRKILDISKRRSIPHCSKTEYENIEKWNYMTLMDLPELFQRPRKKKQINYNEIIQKVKENSKSELVKNIKSKWRSNRIYGNEMGVNYDLHGIKEPSISPMNLIQSNLEKNNANIHELPLYASMQNIDPESIDATGPNLLQKNDVANNQFLEKLEQNIIMEQVSNMSALNSQKISIPPRILLVENESTPEQFIQLASLSPLSITQEGLMNNLTNSLLCHKEIKNKVTSGVNNEKEIRNQSSPVGYLYLQQMPIAERLYVQNSGSAQNKSNSIDNLDDVITIMINPKTLKHKILHAEYLKKSEEKKTPDTLVIDLVPMNATDANTSTTQSKNLSSNIQSSSTSSPSISPTNNTSKLSTKSNQPDTLSIQSSSIPLSYYSTEVNQVAGYSNSEGNSNDGQHLNDFIKLRHSRDLCSVNNDYSQFFECDMPLNEVISSKIPILQASKQEVDAQIDRMIKNASRKENYNNKNIVNCPEKSITEISFSGQNYESHQRTPVYESFTELNKGYKDNHRIVYNDIYKVNPKWLEECSHPPLSTIMELNNLSRLNIKDIKRNISPIIIMYPKSEEEETKEDKKFLSSFSDNLEPKDNPTATQLSNKKVENEMLEGFINSIISNYSKELVTSAPRKAENADGEVLVSLLRNLVSKKGYEGIHLKDRVPIIVPQESITQFKDTNDYEKLGPFSEDIIKTIFTKNSIKLIQENKR